MRRIQMYCIALITLLFACANPAASGQPHFLGMFALYDDNREQGIGNLITTDFAIQAYGMALEETAFRVEMARLRPELDTLLRGLINAMGRGSEARKAAASILAVADHLATGEHFEAEKQMLPQALAVELNKVVAAIGFMRSDITRQILDYSQFAPRGRYAETKEGRCYFRTLRYLSTVLFPVKASEATYMDEDTADLLTAVGLELARAIAADPRLLESHGNFIATATMLFGPTEDIPLDEYLAWADSAGLEASLAEIRQTIFDKAKAAGRQPAIMGSYVEVDGLEPNVTTADVLTGWRLFPQHYGADAAAFQQLVFPEVGPRFKGEEPSFSTTVLNNGTVARGFPLGVELMASFGSEEARAILTDSGDMLYENYESAADRARAILDQAPGLLGRQFDLMRAWLAADGDVAASRRLTGCLALWIRARHMSVLYAKQSYTAATKGLVMAPPKRKERSKAWLEPAPGLYKTLAENLRALAEPARWEGLSALADIYDRLAAISEKELAGRALSEEETRMLNELDRSLAQYTGGPDKPIVVDVHTNPDSKEVLEEALGLPGVVIKEMAGETLRGAVFQCYEFRHPMANRLTDQAWGRLLHDAKWMESATFSPGCRIAD